MIIYQFQPDEAITWRKTPGDEDSDWWVALQKVGATIAIAASLSLTAGQTAQAISVSHQPQDEPVTVPQEEYWQNPVAPVCSKNYVTLPFLDTDETVTPVTTPIEDEDYWQAFPRYVYPVAFQPLFDTPEYVFQPDEDYQLHTSVWPQTTVQQPFSQQDEIVAQPILFVPDEDYAFSVPQKFNTTNLLPYIFDDGSGTFPSATRFVIWIQEDDA